MPGECQIPCCGNILPIPLMPKTSEYSRRRGERGQTILLVAVSLVSLLAMAALAIDVVTLYVAKTEIQRAADAAALAGAKAIADSGITTLNSTDLIINTPQIQNLAQSMATSAIQAVVQTNLVGGSAPTWVNQPLVITYNNLGTSGVSNNPIITVTLQQSNLPAFFARIFGRTGMSTQASATAEAYNPGSLASYNPIAPSCVKPWLVANADPHQGGSPFILSGGVIRNGVLTDSSFFLTANCGVGATCTPNTGSWWHSTSPYQVGYIPATVTPLSTGKICPTCAGSSDYEQAVECCDIKSYAYLNCGGGVTNAQWDNTELPQGAAGDSANGAMCLTHATNEGSANSGQDSIDKTLWPSGPMEITSHSGPQSGNFVSTSNSIATVPIFDQTTYTGAPSVTIVGYLQVFINYVSDGTDGANPGDINVSVMNAVGCSSTPNAIPPAPIVGGNGTSTIPVRLISP